MHFTDVADLGGGALSGVGIGLLLVGLLMMGRQQRAIGG